MFGIHIHKWRYDAPGYRTCVECKIHQTSLLMGWCEITCNDYNEHMEWRKKYLEKQKLAEKNCKYH